MPGIEPFANETDAVSIGDLEIENRLDRVSVYGSLDITRDRAGLDAARRLLAIVAATVTALESQILPERTMPHAVEKIDNPFNQG